MRLPAAALVLRLAILGAAAARASEPPELTIARASGAITIDGDLSDPGWQGASRVETWFETNPGDNVAPQVRNIGYLAYDDRFFYAGFEFEDPHPEQIRAPLGDRDNVPGSTDYGGVILDTRNDGKTGLLILANPRGIQYDAVSDDTSGNEDSSLDLFWDSAARITATGWALEIRVPFSSLRYGDADPQTWGALLYRNWPRDRRVQMFSNRLPRGGNCFICRANRLVGLAGLPHGGHVVVAPFLTAGESWTPRGELGTPLGSGPVDGDGGIDAKWIPNASTAIDGTLNPDFSQIESDVAQIGANERFALLYPERRPFFLEGLELFSTPIQAVYTRSITSPRWGARGTGRSGPYAWTALVAEDRGQGSVILPGPNGSDEATQDFRSVVAVARGRRDFGHSSVSVLGTAREVRRGGHNRVYGPDLQWRPDDENKLSVQVLRSESRTPERPDLASEWDGRTLSGHAADLWFSHSTPRFDAFGEYKDLADGFRADDGFVPQVGYREVYGETGRTFRPRGFFSRIRTFLIADRSADRDGRLLNRQVSVGGGMDGRWSSFLRARVAFDRVRAGETDLPRKQLLFTVQASPTRSVSQLELVGVLGDEIDFENARRGRGTSLTGSGTVRPSDHLELRLNGSRRWLDVRDTGGGRYARLFTASVARLRATYTFTSRAFLRGIVQQVVTHRDLALYLTSDPSSLPDRHEGSIDASLLFSYKLNWQTVLFLGYGDQHSLEPLSGERERAGRQVFLKLSYAFQR